MTFNVFIFLRVFIVNTIDMIKEKKLDNFKSRDLINVGCDYCGNDLKRKKHHALDYEQHYCSNTCKGSDKKDIAKKQILKKGSKVCGSCGLDKKLAEYNLKKGRADGLQDKCKECQKDHAKEYYKVNKEKQKEQINEARRIRVKENREKYFNVLSSNSCVDCSETNPIVLEFDHKDDVDKISGVGKMIGHGNSWDKIKEEMAKCDVRCANCHRIRTAKQQGWYKDLL